MTIATRWRVLVARRATLISLAAATLLHAQEPSETTHPSKADTPAVGRRNDPARRVPDFFGQIGLTPEQREAIYKIRARHQAKIAELEKQIAEIQAQEVNECEGMLTEAQKQLLAQRRKAAAGSGATQAKREKSRDKSN